MIQTFKLFLWQTHKICVGLKMMLTLPFLVTQFCHFFPWWLKKLESFFEEGQNLVFCTCVNDRTSAQIKQLKSKAINLRQKGKCEYHCKDTFYFAEAQERVHCSLWIIACEAVGRRRNKNPLLSAVSVWWFTVNAGPCHGLGICSPRSLLRVPIAAISKVGFSLWQMREAELWTCCFDFDANRKVFIGTA